MKLRYYIYPPSYLGGDCGELEANMKELTNTINFYSDVLDTFCYDNSFYSVLCANGETLMNLLFMKLPDRQFRIVVLPELLKRLAFIDVSIPDKETMDKIFLESENALWGMRFQEEKLYNIDNSEKFKKFKYETVRKNLSRDNFGELNRIIFRNLVFSENAIDQISIVSDKYFSQIISRLEQLDIFSASWKNGSFSIKSVNAQTSLNISDESDSVKNNEKLSRERYFVLPEIGGHYCFLHIKTGDFRFHFYPNEENHRVYIAYVGSHLTV